MKKYPITYKGQLYEVRCTDYLYSTYLKLYKVTKIFNIKILKFIGEANEDRINVPVSKDDPNYYIKQIKALFSSYEEDLKSEQIEVIKQQTLSNWDGII